MPIRFRCSYCNKLLGIATRKAGMETICPHCGYTITVPMPLDEVAQTERVNVDDVEQMLGTGLTERVAESGTQVLAPPAPPRAPAPQEPPEPPRVEQPKPPKVAPPIPRAPAAQPRPAPAASKAAHASDEPPLFEGDVDEILGKPVVLAEDERPKPPPVSGLDAMSLGEPPHMIVISATKATLLLGAVTVLLVLAFVAGYYAAK